MSTAELFAEVLRFVKYFYPAADCQEDPRQTSMAGSNAPFQDN